MTLQFTSENCILPTCFCIFPLIVIFYALFYSNPESNSSRLPKRNVIVTLQLLCCSPGLRFGLSEKRLSSLWLSPDTLNFTVDDMKHFSLPFFCIERRKIRNGRPGGWNMSRMNEISVCCITRQDIDDPARRITRLEMFYCRSDWSIKMLRLPCMLIKKLYSVPLIIAAVRKKEVQSLHSQSPWMFSLNAFIAS